LSDRASLQNVDPFRQLVESIQDYVVVMLDAEGRILSWNPGAARTLGFSTSEIIGGNFSCFYSSADLALGKPARHLEIAARHGIYKEEARRTRKSGESFWAVVTISPLRDDEGTITGFSHVMRDINERKLSDEMSRLMIQLALNAMVMVDSQGVIVHLNAQTEKMFGYSNDELIGQTVEKLVPERFRQRHPLDRHQFFLQPSIRAMGAGRDLFARRKNGSEFPVEIGLNPVKTDDGILVLCSIVDISERKRAEERFRLAVESAPSGMVMINDTGEIVLVNLQTEKLFGYDRDELLGRQIEMLVPDRFRDRHPGYRTDFFKRPAVRAMGAGRDLHGRRRDGSEFPVEIGLTPIETAEGLFVLSAIVDITERKSAEDRSRIHLAELAHAGRLSTVGEMFSGLAHEINQPLAAASNYARACVRFVRAGQGATMEQLAEWMEKTAQQTERACDIVKRLGMFVKKERSSRRTLNLNRVIEHVAMLPMTDVWPSEDARRVVPVLQLEESLPSVVADKVQIEQVLVNLIRNASEAMADMPLEERHLTVRTVNLQEYVQVLVSDTGQGIGPEIVGRLFDPFFTTKAEGMGLGLSISLSIIESHGGRLTVESNAGRGATFSFVLPVLKSEVTP